MLLFPTIWLLPVAVLTGLLVLAAVVSGVEARPDVVIPIRPPARYCTCCETVSLAPARKKPKGPAASTAITANAPADSCLLWRR
jgi:hypothetical protein